MLGGVNAFSVTVVRLKCHSYFLAVKKVFDLFIGKLIKNVTEYTA